MLDVYEKRRMTSLFIQLHFGSAGRISSARFMRYFLDKRKPPPLFIYARGGDSLDVINIFRLFGFNIRNKREFHMARIYPAFYIHYAFPDFKAVNISLLIPLEEQCLFSCRDIILVLKPENYQSV